MTVFLDVMCRLHFHYVSAHAFYAPANISHAPLFSVLNQRLFDTCITNFEGALFFCGVCAYVLTHFYLSLTLSLPLKITCAHTPGET